MILSASQRNLIFETVVFGDHLPGFHRRFRVLKQVQVLVTDHAFVRQELKVDDVVPVFLRVQDNRDGLHSTAYSFQPTLSNGTRPDCLIHLPENDLSVVLDAKFPLEGFNAIKQAEPDSDLRPFQQRFRADVLKHIKDISEKYLIKGETHETAIMFVPSESVYADLHENFEDIIQRAHRHHVIIASPNVLMLLVQTMQAVFKDARMREQASVIQAEVVRLMDDVNRMHDRVLDLQRHFGQAGKDIEKIVISSEKISKRGTKIEQVEFGDAAKRDGGGDSSQPRLVAGE